MRGLLGAALIAASVTFVVGRAAADGKEPVSAPAGVGGPAGAVAGAAARTGGCHRERAEALVKRFLGADGRLRQAARGDGDGASARGLLAARELAVGLARARRALELAPACHDACRSDASERAVDLAIIEVEVGRATALAPVRLGARLSPLCPKRDAKDETELLAALPLLEEMTAAPIEIMRRRELLAAREDALGLAAGRLAGALPEDAARAAALAAARAAVTRRIARIEAALSRAAATDGERRPPGLRAVEADLRVQVELGAGMSIPELLAFGRARLADARAEIEWFAAERLGAESAEAALEHACASAPAPDDPEAARAVAERAVRDALAFVRERRLATVPDEVAAILDVKRGEGREGSFGHYLPPGWAGPRAGYVMSFPGEKLDADARGAMLRANFLQWTRVVAVHETYPGHHLHFGVSTLRGRPIRHRRPHEALVVEGWGLYSERRMFDAGYFDADPWERLAYLGMRLWRAARVVADGLLLSGQADVAGAAAVLEREGLLRPSVARDQAARQKQRRGYYSGYAVGEARLTALAERFCAREVARGARPDEARRAFCDRVVAAGTSTPIEAVEVAVMGP